MAAWVLASVLALEPHVRVVGTTSCPSPAQVAARTEPLVQALPAAPPEAAEEVRLADVGGTLRIELVSQGQRLAVRELPARSDCAQQAELAAVVIAAWHLDLRGATLTAPAPLRAPAPEPSGPTWEAGGAATATVDALGVGAGAAADLAWFPQPRGFGLRLGAWVQAPREVGIATASARWARIAGQALAVHRWQEAWRTLDVHAGLVGAWMSARGRGVDAPATTHGFEPAATAATRVGARTGRWGVWLEVAGLVWLNEQYVFVSPAGSLSPARRTLPRVQVAGSAGVSFFWRP